ncbi:programmed cell death protein 2 [Corchorus olitorius]|uniref:Programmed cell death protein 2 n=1 Tax=Corchorus olitorius TaxID=93759 RepID=A0A1R3KU31_9ROSI|nr:programmed cell death protein 2 [Corchorus olitorius]
MAEVERVSAHCGKTGNTFQELQSSISPAPVRILRHARRCVPLGG